MKKNHNNVELNFLSGGGEMGEHIRSLDWAKTSIGPIAHWPQSLKTALSICLNATMPLSILWSEELIQFYNDAYIPIAVGRHPHILGGRVPQNWPDTWSGIKTYFNHAFEGNASYVEDTLLVTHRKGILEECYYTMSFSPIRDESGAVGGVFHAILETSVKVINERRLQTSRNLAAKLADAKTVEDVFLQASRLLSENLYDIPFTLFYSYTEDNQSLKLLAASGLNPDLLISPKEIGLAQINAVLPFRTVIERNQAELVEDLEERMGVIEAKPWSMATQKALVLPITLPGKSQPSALWVAGISPRLALTESYYHFFDQLTGHISAALANVLAYEEERKRAEALSEIDRAKITFFSNVSHEFRTPLTLLLGPLEELITQQASQQKAQGLAKVAHRNALRLQKLVNMLLDFSRLEEGRLQASYQPTNLSRLTTALASNFRAVIEKAGLKLKVECPTLPELIYLDRDMWEKIVLNLLSNAFKHTFEGEIQVITRWQNERVELLVQDTGIGIPSDQLPHLFERFHQVPHARSRTHEGSGIGLALVHELVKLHGGRITVESVVDQGTLFTVSIPTGKAHLPTDRLKAASTLSSTTLGAQPFVEEALRWLIEEDSESFNLLTYTQETGMQAESWHTTTPASKDKARIIIVDDNADMRDYLSRLLAPHCEVEALPDGQAALAAAQRKKPDLLLLDIMMPHMNGFSLLSLIRNDPHLQSIPVILLSARAGEEAKVEGLQAGADDYLVKPFSAKELLARVQTHLALARLRKQASTALKAERQRLYDLLMNAPASVAILSGPDLIFEFANPQYRKLLGIDHNIDGKPLLEVAPDIAPALLETIKKAAFQGERFVTYEIPILLDWDEKGTAYTKYFNLVYEPLHAENHQPNGLVCFAFEVTEQVKVRQKIQESEEKYRRLFERMDQGFCILEMIFDANDKPLDYRFLEVNPTFEQHTGLKGAAGKTARELLPDLEEHWFEIYGRVALTGESIHFTEGSEVMGRWFEVHAFRLGGSQSRKVALLFTDITQRRQTEGTLQRSNEWFQLVNKATQDAIWDWDLVTQKVNWNEAVQTMFNYQQEEVGQDATWWYEHIHPEDREWVVKDIHSVIETGKVHWSKEYRYLTGDGGFKIVFDRGFVLHDASGKPVRMIGSMQDITERKQAEQTIKESEHLFRTFANNIQNLAWIAQPDGWIYWYNQRWYEYTGTTLEEMQGWGWQQVHHPAHKERVLAFVQKAWGKGETWELTFPLKGADGRYRWFLTRAYAVKDATGKVERWIGTNTDIDDQKMAEQQLHALTQELAASNEELAAASEEIQANLEELSAKNKALSAINADMDNFIYTASHDLKAPISNIEGLLQMLHRNLPEDITNAAQMQKLFKLMSSSTERFKKTIIDLTQVAKVEKELDEPIGLVNIAEVIEEVLLDLEFILQASQASIEKNLHPCPLVTFSAKNMKSIVYNLVSNAIKYRHANRKPKVKISCKQERDFVELTVADNGLGIQKADQDKIFAMFKRLHSHVEGTGIGLYIVKKMVDSAGGRIQVESEIGKGSTFSLYFRH